MTPTYRYAAVVRRIVDGDTLDVDLDLGLRTWRHRERLRLAGIDAPEVRGPEREAGRAAADWLREQLPVGAEIVVETERDPDNFGRWVAWVWRREDDEPLNNRLVRAGHAEWSDG